MELYGPVIITFSLVAVLLYGMKTSGHEMVSVPKGSWPCQYEHMLHIITGRRNFDWNSNGHMFQLLVGDFQFDVLHCVLVELSDINGASVLSDSEFICHHMCSSIRYAPNAPSSGQAPTNARLSTVWERGPIGCISH